MPQVFIGDVFGLNTVYDDQVLNIEQRNFINWPESATYGYYGGGYVTSTINTISRLEFPNETVSNPGKNLPTVARIFTATSSAFYGYFAGGYDGTVNLNTIARLDFSSEVVSLPGKNLPTARRGLNSISSSSYGYFAGGFTTVLLSSIVRLDFSNETISDPGKNLPAVISNSSTISNSSYGYFGGGYGPGPSNYSTITRFDFLSETASNPGRNLPTARRLLEAISSPSYGYFGGGYSGGYINTITRFDFLSETVSNPGKNLPTTIGNTATTSSSSYGYYAGGATPVTINTISRLDFSNEIVSNPGKNLPTSRNSLTALSGGQSVFRPQGGGSKTYGYIAAGAFTPPFSTFSDIYRIDFSSDVSALLPGVGLPAVGATNGRRVMGSAASNYYGYFGGGYFPTPSYMNRIDRIDFSNSTTSVPGNNLPIDGRFSGASGSSYGFFTGYNGSGSVAAAILLDFSSEVISSTPQPNGGGGGYQSSVSNTVSNYGYNMNSGVTRRIDFSTSNISLPGQDTPLISRTNIAGFENRQYGYFGGGYGSSTYRCVLDRLDFSNETYTASTNLPLSRSWHSGASSNTHGYFFAGSLFPGLTLTNSIIKFDFASSAWNTSITPSIPTRYQTSAVSN